MKELSTLGKYNLFPLYRQTVVTEDCDVYDGFRGAPTLTQITLAGFANMHIYSVCSDTCTH